MFGDFVVIASLPNSDLLLLGRKRAVAIVTNMEPTNQMEVASVEETFKTTTTKISFGVAAQKKTAIQKTTVMRTKSDDEDEGETEVKRRKLTHFEDGVMVE